MSNDAAKPIEGEYKRKPSEFMNRVTADGASGFKAEANRYHLYVALACPFAQRALVARKLKGLDDIISCTIVDPFLDLSVGWTFTDKKPKCTLDTVTGSKTLRQVYKLANPEYAGKVTVPVLWDKKQKTIVSNDSSDITRMLSSEFNAFCKTPEQSGLDLYPEHLRDAIDEVNSWVYPRINNGVYRCGFAESQEAYNIAVKELNEALDKAEDILSRQRYLVGNKMTEADVKLFTSLARFDNVYHTLFKCNKKQLIDYPNLWGFTRDMYQIPGVSDTVDTQHIIHNYYESLKKINPFGIVPVCPMPDFTEPHDRNRF